MRCQALEAARRLASEGTKGNGVTVLFSRRPGREPMVINWTQRRALERRMRGRGFRAASLAWAAAVRARSVQPLLARLSQGASIGDLVAACLAHGVAGHAVTFDDIDTLPGEMSDAVRAEAVRIALRAERLTGEIVSLGEAAAAAGLAFAPLKGTYLRSERYPSTALRPSADIDVLIGDEDLAAWREVLRVRGYTHAVQSGRHWVFVRPGQQAVAAEGDHPDHPCPVELHTRITDRVFGREVDVTDAYRADLHDVRLRAGVAARAPGPVALALHLFLHAAPAMLDRGLRLAQVLDFAYVDDDAATVAAVRDRLGAVVWAVAALLDRDVPGVLAAGWRADADGGGLSRMQRRVALSRPGLLRGDPYRLSTLTGDLLLSRSPRAVLDRVRQSLAARHAFD